MFHDLHRQLGPTFPGNNYSCSLTSAFTLITKKFFIKGVLDTARNIYVLDYQGVSFLFPLESQLAKNLQGISSATPRSTSSWLERSCSIPHELLEKQIDSSLGDDPRSFVFTRAFIHSSNSLCEASMQRTLDPGAYQAVTSLVMPAVSVHVYIHQGIYVPQHKIFISFNTTLQECWSDLGEPDHEFHKNGGDFFLNYFSLGFDLMIDGTTQRCYPSYIILHVGYHLSFRVKKILLHSNNPSTSTFSNHT